MRAHPGATYHALDGDRDLRFLAPHVRPGNRLLVSFHNPPSELERFALRALVASHVHAAILVSESQRGWFDGLLPASRVFVVPHGVDTTFFSPDASARPAAEPLLVTVGSHLRDFETLAQALELLWRDHPSVRLTAVGATPEWLARLGSGR